MNLVGGDLTLILGTMFSGKTTYLLSELSKLSGICARILYINSALDVRSKSAFSTHNPFLQVNEIPRNLTMIKTANLMDVNISDYDIVAIDESQFFPDLLEFVSYALKSNKCLLVAGLIADSNGKKFGQIVELVPICTDIVRLKAFCTECAKCGTFRVASHSKRISASLDKHDIGGVDKYTPVCRAHI